MIRKIIIVAAVLAIFHATLAMASAAQEVWFCQTCSSTGDAENFVIANAEAKNAGGDRTIEVINLNTYTWFIEYNTSQETLRLHLLTAPHPAPQAIPLSQELSLLRKKRLSL